MYSLLETIGQQIVKHSTGTGKLWYLLVFGFRMMATSVLGSQVYGDEQGGFICSALSTGCKNMCYDEFTRMSHVRFWAVQIIAISTPTAIFHLYVTHVHSQIQKIEEAKKLQEANDAVDEPLSSEHQKQVSQIEKRIRNVGEYKMKKVVRGQDTTEIPQTKGLTIANVINLVFRMLIEVAFILLSSYFYNMKDNRRQDRYMSFTEYFTADVPGYYKCMGLNEATSIACKPHILDGNFAPCFVSRPYEKTVLLRYMNWISVICVLLTAYEIYAIGMRAWKHSNRKEKLLKQNVPLMPSFPTNTSGGRTNDYEYGEQPRHNIYSPDYANSNEAVLSDGRKSSKHEHTAVNMDDRKVGSDARDKASVRGRSTRKIDLI